MATLGMRGTGSFAADHRPENYREKYLMLEPNGSAPLTAILSMLPSEGTDDPEFHNFRKDLPEFRFTHSGAGSNSATTLTETIDSATNTLTLDLSEGTLTGTTAQFNTALSDGSFATLAGAETLTNKTIDVDNNTVSNIEVDNLKSGVLDTDLTSVSASDDTLASAKAIKTYVDSQVTAQDLDFQGDSGGALSIDLDSETFTIAGGTGIDTSGSGNTLSVAIDNTVATKGFAIAMAVAL